MKFMSIKLWIIEDDSNYTCSCVTLPELRDVSGLDNLKLATIFGYGCLVGKDSPKGKYLFFPAETVLSQEFLRENNLFRSNLANKDTTKTWFFQLDGRVRAVKFKWVVSSGFLIPITSLNYLGYGWEHSELRIGDNFHSIDGKEICRKYRRPVAPVRLNRNERVQKKWTRHDRVIPTQFRFHTSTPQFLKFLSDFNEGERVTITEKLHWTSAVFANVLTKRELWFMETMAKAIWIRVEETEYFPLYSSRTVIKNSDINDGVDGGYYWEDLWGKYAKLLEWKIEKWITLYGAIVGYTSSGAYIQQGYSYGCKPWESKFYCYRITYTTPDGNVIEFTDSQIRQYCRARQIEVAPLIESFNLWDVENDEFCSYYSVDYITSKYLEAIEVMCPLNANKVPREWVVIRRDGQEFFSAYKLKSQLFLTYETKQIDEGKEDTEEAN